MNQKDLPPILETAVAAVRIYAESHPRPAHVTKAQAAEMLNVSQPTLNAMIQRGIVSMNKAGRIPISQVDKVLDPYQ